MGISVKKTVEQDLFLNYFKSPAGQSLFSSIEVFQITYFFTMDKFHGKDKMIWIFSVDFRRVHILHSFEVLFEDLYVICFACEVNLFDNMFSDLIDNPRHVIGLKGFDPFMSHFCHGIKYFKIRFDDKADTRTLNLDSNGFSCLPQHRFMHLSKRSCSYRGFFKFGEKIFKVSPKGIFNYFFYLFKIFMINIFP